MILRDLRAGEARRFEEIRIAGWHAAYGGILHPEVLRHAVLDEERVAWRERWLADPPADQVTLVAEVDGELAGGAFLWLSPAGEAELATLYVDPDRRGSGLGKALLEEGFRRMPQDEQVLWTFEQNASARGFYERLGFAVDGARRTLPMLGDPVEVRYRRRRRQRASGLGPSSSRRSSSTE